MSRRVFGTEFLSAGLVRDITDFLAAYGLWGLLALTFAEASFLPVFPEVLFIPMALINPSLALFYALAATLSSTSGGLFGRWIGLKAGRPLLERLASGRKARLIEDWFQRYGAWAVGLAALTPAPYKFFTIASGVFGVAARPVVLGSFFGRGTRFFTEALVIMLAGERAEEFLARYADELLLTGGLLLAAWVMWRQYLKNRKTG